MLNFKDSAKADWTCSVSNNHMVHVQGTLLVVYVSRTLRNLICCCSNDSYDTKGKVVVLNILFCIIRLEAQFISLD